MGAKMFGTASIEFDRLIKPKEKIKQEPNPIPTFDMNEQFIIIGNAALLILGIISGLAGAMTLYEKLGGKVPKVLKDFELEMPEIF